MPTSTLPSMRPHLLQGHPSHCHYLGQIYSNHHTIQANPDSRDSYIFLCCTKFSLTVKVELNRFGLTHTGHLVLKTAFNSDKLAIKGPFICLNCIVNIFQCDRTSRKLHSIVKIENKNCYQWEDCHYLLGARDLPASNRVMLVASMLGKVFSLHEEWIQSIISATFVGSPMVVIDVNHEKKENSINIVSNASCCTANCLVPRVKSTVTISASLWN